MSRTVPKEIKNLDHIKFISKIDDSSGDGCWPYIGAKDGNGYGRVYLWINGKSSAYQAHRVSYHIFKGKLDLNKVLDHKCMNRSCVNPDHLREVEFKVNLLENSNGVSAINSIKTHCPQGHVYTKNNTNGSRYCSICKKEAKARYKLKITRGYDD